MTKDKSDDAPSEELPLFLQATLDDFQSFDFEEPIDELADADCRSLSSRFTEEARLAEAEAEYRKLKVYTALSALCNFHFKAGDYTEPFAAMMVWGGQRSPIPEDFRGELLEALIEIAPQIRSSVLGARISDMIWVVDRSKHQHGTNAVKSYIKIIEEIQQGIRFFRNSQGDIFANGILDLLRRALIISRGLGKPEEIYSLLKGKVLELRNQAIQSQEPKNVYRISELDLDFSISEPEEVSRSFEPIIGNEEFLLDRSKYWQLAARGFHKAKLDDDKWRCTCFAAECLASFAEDQDAGIARSHWFADALAAYKDVPNKRERRDELRQKLVESQRDVHEEMSPFSQEMDITELVSATEKEIEDASLFKKLGILACVTESPAPEALKEDAIGRIKENPLSSLFASSYHDSEGKVVHRGTGADLYELEESSVSDEVARHESIRRNLVVSSAIVPILRNIQWEEYVGSAEISLICEYSPFVPIDRRETFVHGLLAFVRGDQFSALNVLVPQLENSIRHILKLNDYDPTSFDEVSQTQADRSLTSLYMDMRDEINQCFGEDTAIEIENLFIKKNGPNMRNLVAHGLLPDGAVYNSDAIYVNWLIYRLCCWSLLSYWGDLETRL